MIRDAGIHERGSVVLNTHKYHSCFDCGAKDHRRGSSECKKPSYLTLMIKKRREDRNGGPSDGAANQDSKNFFRKRSGED